MTDPQESEKPREPEKPESPWQPGQNPFSDVSPTYAKPPAGDFYQPVAPPPGWRGDSINGLAIAGLVFSILSAVCCPIFGIIGLSLAIPAYYMAQNDLALYSQSLHPVLLGKLTTAKNLALAGIVVGAIGIVMNFICFGVQFGAAFLEAMSQEF